MTLDGHIYLTDLYFNNWLCYLLAEAGDLNGLYCPVDVLCPGGSNIKYIGTNEVAGQWMFGLHYLHTKYNIKYANKSVTF